MLGVYTAINRRGILANVVMSVSLIGVSLPTFLIGIGLIYLFAVELRWLPSFGRGEVVKFGWWSTGLLTDSGRKSLIAFSRPFAMSRYAPARWVTAEGNLDWLIVALDDSPHIALAPKTVLRQQRRATAFEREVTDRAEWRPPRKSRGPRKS